MWDIAAPLPLILIGDMLGFERDAYDDLLRWSDDMITRHDGRRRAGPPEVDGGGDGLPRVQLGVIADRRAEPRSPTW